MKRKLLNLSFAVAIFAMIAGCYPGGAEFTSDTDIVLTNYNDAFDFGSVKTYFMSDSINHIVEDGEEADYSLDPHIITELSKSLDNLGYERLFPEDSTGPEPDVLILVSSIKVTNYQVYGGYPWYGGWGYGYGWYKSTSYYNYYGYGWGYPYYPTYVTSYETGTLAWNMVEPDNENEVLNVEWIGALNGVLGSNKITTKNRISDGIIQAFEQSPYL